MLQEELKKLEQLSFSKQATFAYLTCERLYPNYVYFSKKFDVGNPTILREAIDFVYSNIFEDTPDKTKVNFLSKEVEKNTPDTEDFSSHFVSSALDACTTVLESLSFLVDKKTSRIIDISSFATDSVDMYIQEIETLDFNKDKEFRQKIDNHLLMQREVSIQQGIITFLNKRKDLDYGDLQTLLNLQDNNKKSNLGL